MDHMWHENNLGEGGGELGDDKNEHAQYAINGSVGVFSLPFVFAKPEVIRVIYVVNAAKRPIIFGKQARRYFCLFQVSP